MTQQLRWYQEDGIQMAKNSLMDGKKRVVIALATGGGKSLICEKMITGAMEKGKRVMFLVNRVQLADQMSAHLYRAKIQHGVIQGANTRGAYHNVVIASIDTIHTRGYPLADLILADEAHSAAGSAKYRKLFEHYKDIPIIGVTATPMVKGLGKSYPWGALFEDIVCPVTIPQLIDEGYLVDVDIYAPSAPDLSKVKVVAGEYHEGQLAEASDKPSLIGDIVKTWMKHAKGKQTICFAVNIPHSKHIVEKFVEAGITAEHIDYSMTYEEKSAIVKRFKNGEFMLLSNCALLAEGFDAPATECMILARATKSFKAYIQMVGRVLRPFNGKDRAILLDHAGSSTKFPYPTEEIEYTLCDGKPNKAAEKDSKKADKSLPSICPSCKYVKKKSGQCPICGFLSSKQNSTECAPGELEITKKKKDVKKNRVADMDKQTVYSELFRIAEERQYQKGWIANQYRTIFGVWPKSMKEVGRPPSLEVRNKVQASAIRFHKSRAA